MDVPISILLLLSVLGLAVVLVTTTTPGRLGQSGRPALFESTVRYRLEDGSEDYAFRIRQMPDQTFRIYILHPTAIGPHRLSDESGLQYICWSQPINNYENAKAVARTWAEATHRYFQTGKHF